MRRIRAATFALGPGNPSGVICINKSVNNARPHMETASAALLIDHLLPRKFEQPLQPDRSDSVFISRSATFTNDSFRNPLLSTPVHRRILSPLLVAHLRHTLRDVDRIVRGVPRS